MNDQITIAYNNSVYDLKQEASKMKTIFILLLFFCNSLQSQAAFSDKSTTTQFNYIVSNKNDLLDENGNSILDQNRFASIVFTGETTSNDFGYSVSSAGDLNGDGYSDVVVGANRNNSGMGKANIFLSGEIIDNVADKTFLANNVNAQFGISVSLTGDVNNAGGGNCRGRNIFSK